MSDIRKLIKKIREENNSITEYLDLIEKRLMKYDYLEINDYSKLSPFLAANVPEFMKDGTSKYDLHEIYYDGITLVDSADITKYLTNKLKEILKKGHELL